MVYRRDRTLEPEKSSMMTTNVLGATVPETGFTPSVLPPGREVKSLDPVVKSSTLGPVTPLDKQSESLALSGAQAGDRHGPVLSERTSEVWVLLLLFHRGQETIIHPGNKISGPKTVDP